MAEYVALRARWLALAVLLAAAIATPGGVPGRTPAEQLGALVGAPVRASDVVWVDPAPDEDGPWGAFALRRIVFAAAAGQGGGPRDVYTAVVRALPNGRIVAAYALRNVTRSAEADEGDLLAGPGGFVAFAVRVGGVGVGVGVLGFPEAGAGPGAEDEEWDRVRAALRDWERDGRPQGIALRRLLLPAPAAAPLRFGFDPVGELVVSSGAERVAALAPASGRLSCPRGGCVLETRERGLLPLGAWAADVLRAGGAGRTLVVRLEELALTWRDRWSAVVAALGGASPSRAAAQAVEQATVPAPAESVSADEAELEPPAWPPPPLVPLVAPPLPGEGEWRAFDARLVRPGPRGPALLGTFLRPDPSRADRAQVLVTIWDPAVVDLGFAPGTLDPPAADGTLPAGRVPRDPALLGRLLAGLSGGFQAIDGQFGEVVDRRVFVPVQPWAATVARFDDGAIGLGTWPPGLPDLPPGIASLRQNLSPLVEDGVVNPYGRKAWGGLAPAVPAAGRDEDVVPTVRSALCATADGLLAHLWGSFLTVRTLAAAAVAARCTYAIALDINPGNAIVELYRVGTSAELEALGPPGAGEASGELPPTGLRYRAHLLAPEMADDPGRFLEASERDVLYLALRAEPAAERPPPADEWDDGGRARPVFAGDRAALRRLFPDVAPVPPATWWPVQRAELPREYVRRIERLWRSKGGGGGGGR